MLDDPFGWVGHTVDGKLEVERVAGEGAFAVVYRAQHLALGEPVAIKCLKVPGQVTQIDRDALIQAFRGEARTLHRLSRRTAGIVQALDVGAATSPSGAWTPYIVMEWLEGETLQAELARRAHAGKPPRDPSAAMDLLAPAAEALAIAHDEGVVHRDVKPQNLFLVEPRRSTDAPMLKVLDFGIAKLVTETSARTHGSAAAIQAFTPQYAAPEQFNAQYGRAGPWTDVFAMALVFVEVCSGRAALEGSELLQLYVASVDETKRPSLSRRGVAVAPEIEEVLARALAVLPERRWPNMSAFWRALEQARHASRRAAEPASAEISQPPPYVAFDPTIRVPAKPPVGPGPARPGARVGEPSRPASSGAGENRICTVVFVGLSGMDALTTQLEPDQMREIHDYATGIVAEQIEKMGGVLDRVVGDSITAAFGIPKAADDDAERAVGAALAIVDALAHVALPVRALRRWRPSARIGIATGRVFAAAPSDHPSAGGRGLASAAGAGRVTVIGEAVQLAARLQQIASDGAVLVAPSTRRLVGAAFDVSEASDPGQTEGAFRVSGAAIGRAMTRVGSFRGLRTELVGRSAEMVRIRDLLDEARAEPRARLVTIVGEPGIGRTRLLAEVCDVISRERSERRGEAEGRAENQVEQDRGWTLVTAQPTTLAAETTYATASMLVRGLLGLGARPTTDELTAAVARLAEARAVDVSDVDSLVASLTTLLGTGIDAPTAPESGSATLRDVVASERGASNKQRLAAAAARLLGLVLASGPCALVCDDAHWADDASLDLLDDLVLRLADSPLLVLVAARPLLSDRRPHWGEGKPAHARIELSALARRHVEQMTRDRLRKVPDLPTDVVRQLAERAEGVPLYLEESLHLLADAGVIDTSDTARWVLHADRLGGLELSPTVQGIVQARLDRLPEPLRLTIAHACVVGRTFWREAVQAVRDADVGTGAPPLDPLLAELRQRRMVQARESSTLASAQELVFTEGAIQEVAYASLSVRAKRTLHRAVARWLASRSEGDATDALLAHHHDRGGDKRAAAATYARAGARAASLGQNEQALRLLERAREIHDEAVDPDGGGDISESTVSLLDDPVDARVATWRERARLRLDLGDVLRSLGRLDDAERAYEEARARVLTTESRESEAYEASEALLWESRTLHRLALTSKVRGENAVARERIERAIDLATRAGALEETPAMWAVLAGIHHREGDHARWQEACRMGLRTCRKLADRDERTRDAISTLLTTLGGLFYTTGRLVRAERLYRQAARAVDETSQPQPAARALSDAGAVRFARGDVAGARELFQRALVLKERAGDLFQIAIACSNLAEVELALGRTEAALSHARRAVTLGERVDARADLPDMLKNFARASLVAGRASDAVTATMRAVALVREEAALLYLEPVLALAADVLEACPDARDLAEALRSTLELHQSRVPAALAARCVELAGGDAR